MTAFLGAARTFALRFFMALLASFLVLYAALYAADRVEATDIHSATQLHFRQGSLHDTGHADDPGQPANFLIVGSDTRGFVHSAVDVAHFGSASGDPGARSDTLMIAHIDPNSKQAMIVSFPRDLQVTLPGGCKMKINAAYNQDTRCNSHSPYGGPQQIVDTLKLNFGISINHYVEVNFPGFVQMVNVLGTVPIYFPATAKDVYTGLSENGGCQGLTGIQALDYVRSRHYQYVDYKTGRWVKQGLSDLARIGRQQYFIRTLMQTAIDKGSRNVITALDFASEMSKSVAVDSNFTAGDLNRLIKTFRLTDPGAVRMITVPTVSSAPGLRKGNLALGAGAQAIFQQLNAFTPKPPPPVKYAYQPAQVRVEVRDASGTSTPVSGATTTTDVTGASSAATARAATLLGRIGFSYAVGPPAPASDRTVVEFTKANAGKALVLVAHMTGSPKLVQVAALSGDADVLLLVGRSGSGLIDPNAPTTTTTTTVPGSGPAVTTTTVLPNPGTPPAGTPASAVKSQWIGCQ